MFFVLVYNIIISSSLQFTIILKEEDMPITTTS